MELTIALAKGRLAKFAIELFSKCGIDTAELEEDTRKLVVYDKKNELRFILVKPTDVPVYVYRGVADIGIAGKDTLLEAGLPLYEMLDLKCGKCKMCVAGYAEKQNDRITSTITRVATKYPRVAKMYYNEKGEDIEIIKLNGSIELAPILDLSDVIVDIVESGTTIRENGLAILEDVCDISARLVVNQVSLKTKADKIQPLIGKLGEALEEM
ncbi:ATP phosphoribosyltransferase [Christensenella timonensis]|uniref:ATP phosphoribosyltransferase n=1 Tax=Christensenella timonensis TaxID=1816678 RepID=UPI000833E88C|nr:ATP phosphoribosyltransferase [Christensenella timonensis]